MVRDGSRREKVVRARSRTHASDPSLSIRGLASGRAFLFVLTLHIFDIEHKMGLGTVSANMSKPPFTTRLVPGSRTSDLARAEIWCECPLSTHCCHSRAEPNVRFRPLGQERRQAQHRRHHRAWLCAPICHRSPPIANSGTKPIPRCRGSRRTHRAVTALRLWPIEISAA